MKLIPALVSVFGYDAVSKRKSHQTLIRHLSQVLDCHAIDRVIDVGANAGQFCDRLRKAHYRGRIEAFEPIPAQVDALKRKFANDPQFRVHACALGEADGEMSLNVFEGDDFSSFLSLRQEGRKYFPERTQPKTTIRVPVRRLDRIDGICNPADRVLLKMDTQGFDLNVFQGATDVLPNVCALLIECSVIPLYEKMPDFLETLKVFQQAGFLPSGFFPVSRDKTNMTIIEFDCVLIRQNAMAS